jgi:FMN phosphatase YigB (HAD superfamily)
MVEMDVDVVLFDLGGVLFDFGGVDAMKRLARIDDDEELWRRWLGCPWVRTFERGGCSAEDFAAGVVSEWGLAVEPYEFLDSFRSWLGGPFDGAEELVEQTQRVVRVGCLSNTNAVHWNDHESRWSVLRAFDVRFLSFQIGCVKPDREIFDRVAGALAVPRDKVLFLDDNAINVEGAAAAGFNSMRTLGVEGARANLAALGILPPK